MRILERRGWVFKPLVYWAMPVIGSLLLLGCGQPASQVPPEPFKAAVAEYLDQHNMGLSIKEIKQGPNVDGNTANMKASLQATGAGGPAVTWEFRFEKTAEGRWKAISHKP